MNLMDVVIPGDRIGMKLTEQENEEEYSGMMTKHFQSSVSDVLSENEMEILMPVQGGKMILFQVGMECDFVIFSHKGMFMCSGTVEKRYRTDNLFLLAVTIQTELKKVQRRKFFRIDYVTRFHYYEINDAVANLTTTSALFAEIQGAKYLNARHEAVMVDISGGGTKFSTKEKLVPEKKILLCIGLSNDKLDEKFYLVGRVVESQKHPKVNDLYVNRCQFVFKDLIDREKIVSFVFEEERKIRRKEIE